MRLGIVKCLAGMCACAGLGLIPSAARGQTFRYESEPRAGDFDFDYADPAPAPPLWAASEPSFTRPAPPHRAFRDRRLPPNRLRAAYHRPARLASAGYADDPRLAQTPARPRSIEDQPFVEDGPPIPPEGYGEYRDGDYYVPAEPYAGGEPYAGDPYLDGSVHGEPFLDGPSCGGCGACDECCRPYLAPGLRCLREAAARGAFCENLDLFTGKQGFKGPVDQGLNGDFGYHFGFNWGMPVIDAVGLGYQVGGNLIVSDFEGASGPLGHSRTQFFLTTGLFHRAVCGQGFQGGFVWDYLRDDFYVQMDLNQIRAEVSYVWNQHEVGLWGAFGTNTSTSRGNLSGGPTQTFRFQGNDQYNAFYRYQFCSGTYCRTWAGLSEDGDAIFGSDATVYISQRMGLIATYNYLLPWTGAAEAANTRESWNLTISMVWYPFYKCRDSWLNPYRPLFYTADNGWFLVQ